MPIQEPVLVKKEPVIISAHSSFFNADITLEGFIKEKSGEKILSHMGLKKNFLRYMLSCATNPEDIPVTFEYIPRVVSQGHCAVSCVIKKGNYSVIETGEATMKTMYTEDARAYPYLEAEKRAFDRAFLTFFQIDVDGKRIYSESEEDPYEH